MGSHPEQGFTGGATVVVGLGYAGLPFALALATAGLTIHGFDIDDDRRASILSGDPVLVEPGSLGLLREHLSKGTLRIVGDIPAAVDTAIVVVGTPIRKDGSVDLCQIRSACSAVGKALVSNSTVLVRSTVPVGTCRSALVPVLEEASTLQGGVDFQVVFSPELAFVGTPVRDLARLPQIVGGLTPSCLEAGAQLLKRMSPTVVEVGSLEEAELIKLMSNGFRDVVLGFANEAAQICSHYGIDAHDAIRAANTGGITDPIPSPGPGVGGPCLPKDSVMYAQAAREAGVASPLVLGARTASKAMAGYMVRGLTDGLARLGKHPSDVTVVLAGMAFKGRPPTADTRESPGLSLLRLLEPVVAQVRIHDPVVPAAHLTRMGGRVHHDLLSAASGADALVVLTNHPDYEEDRLMDVIVRLRRPALVVDTWGLLDGHRVRSAGQVAYQRLGASRITDDVAASG